jgi:hypothetical protein
MGPGGKKTSRRRVTPKTRGVRQDILPPNLRVRGERVGVVSIGGIMREGLYTPRKTGRGEENKVVSQEKLNRCFIAIIATSISVRRY